MTLIMSLIMTFNMAERVKLYTEKDLDFERVFEVKILDLRSRKGIKQRSFSILVKKGTKDEDYPSAEELRDFIDGKSKEINI